MSLQGTIEIDGKKQAVKAGAVRISLQPVSDAQQAAGGQDGPTSVTETISLSGDVLVISVTVKQGGRTTTTTTTSNSNDGSQSTTTTTTDEGGNTSTTIDIKRK